MQSDRFSTSTRSISAQETARPVFELAFRWLREHLPPAVTPVLVHGDYRHGNLIIGTQGVHAVLDWELAHIGDPVEDLAWLCIPPWRFGELDKPVGGFGQREDLLAAYERASGRSIDRARLAWWDVLGSLRWGIMCADMPKWLRSGRDTSVERAMIARRASESELDLLRILCAATWICQAKRAKPSGNHMQDPPTVTELLEATAAFLREVAVPQLSGHASFHARVAANALDIVKRELELRPAVRARRARETQRAAAHRRLARRIEFAA